MNGLNPKVDAYLKRSDPWHEESAALRRIVLSRPLVEELKWGKPCYTFEGRNVVLIHGFKDYCALLFMKGALLKNRGGLLVRQTENTQAARQVRFVSRQAVTDLESTLKALLDEAIDIEKSGQKIQFKSTAELVYPEEFQIKLKEMPELKAAFGALTPGRQRGYNLYFSAATQSKTRAARVEKCIERVLAGKGLDDE